MFASSESILSNRQRKRIIKVAIGAYTIKCPECGASLDVEEGRKQLFCSYCGSKVLINNENEHIYRHIDEARIKEAETDRLIKLKELELESEDRKNRKNLITVWVIATGIFALLGVIGIITGNDNLEMCILIAMNVALWGGIFLFANKNKKRHVVNNSDVVISSVMSNCAGKNYNNVLELYKGAGFVNVTAVPLEDLNVFTIMNSGKVECVSINGEDDFDEGDVFPKTSNVLIAYHSGK